MYVSSKKNIRSRWALAGAAATLGLVLLANGLRTSVTIGGELQATPQRDAFLSGGARSERVLRDIHEVLLRIDARLERFERALNEPEKPSRAPAPDERGVPTMEPDAANELR